MYPYGLITICGERILSAIRTDGGFEFTTTGKTYHVSDDFLNNMPMQPMSETYQSRCSYCGRKNTGKEVCSGCGAPL